MSHQLEIRGTVSLEEPVVIATQESSRYKPIIIPLPDGEIVSLEPELNQAALEEDYRRAKSQDERFVISCVLCLRILVTIESVDDDELARLKCVHPTARRFTAHGREHQESEEFGNRIVAAICSASNSVIKQIRDRYGQEWLRPILPGHPPSNFLFDIQAEWREPDGEWSDLRTGVAAHTLTASLGGGSTYLEVADWGAISAVPRSDGSDERLALFAEARRQYREGDLSFAVLLLNIVAELTAVRFLEKELRGVLPERTLKSVSRQRFSDLLSHWVIPLAEQKGIRTETVNWQEIQKLMRLRRIAAHGRVDRAQLEADSWRTFTNVVNNMMDSLLAERCYKLPAYFPSNGAIIGP